jgi:putative RecB family exonuclease
MNKQVEPALPTGLSPSSLGTYTKCPRRFQEEKINGRASPSSVDAELGTLVHLILEKLFDRPSDKRTLEDARECARDAWRETLDVEDFIALNLDHDDQRDFRWRAWRSIETYFTMEDPSKVNVVATEKKMNAVLNGVPVRGIVDRIELDENGDIVVDDYKNGKVPDPAWPDQAEEKRDQMNIYAGMIEAETGKLPARGRLIFTAHGVDYPVEFTPESVQETAVKLRKAWDEIQANFAKGGHWKAKPSGLCSWCPFMEECEPGFAEATFRYLKGKVRQDAPGYAVLARTAHLGKN